MLNPKLEQALEKALVLLQEAGVQCVVLGPGRYHIGVSLTTQPDGRAVVAFPNKTEKWDRRLLRKEVFDKLIEEAIDRPDAKEAR